MKKLIGLCIIVFVLIWVSIMTGCGLNPNPSPNPSLTPSPSQSPDPPPVLGRNIVHYDGDPSSSMGANESAECLVYFNTAKLQSYIGCNLTGLQIYYAEDGNFETMPYTVKVYNGVGGTAASPGTLLYCDVYTFNEDAWNEVTLPTPIPITTGLVIWAGFSCSCPSAWPMS